MRRLAAAVMFAIGGLGLATPAAAQMSSGYLLRPFVLVDEQWFTAKDTFKAIFGEAQQPLWGGGLTVIEEDRYYLDIGLTRFKKTGQRAFFNNGRAFPLGIPLSATLTTIELTTGVQFHPGRRRPTRLSSLPPRPSRLVPYVGGGGGLYRYRESSDFDAAGDAVEKQHLGVILEGGLEVRLQRWVGISVGAHYAYVPGILGTGGVSQLADEKDLGGLSGRLRLIIGK